MARGNCPIKFTLSRSRCTAWSLPKSNSSCQPALWPWGSALNQREIGNPSWTNPPNPRRARCGATVTVPAQDPGVIPFTEGPVAVKVPLQPSKSGPEPASGQLRRDLAAPHRAGNLKTVRDGAGDAASAVVGGRAQ